MECFWLTREKGYAVVLWVKLWPTDLVISVRTPLEVEIFWFLNGIPLNTAFIIIHPLSWYDWNTVEKDTKSQVVRPSIYREKKNSGPISRDYSKKSQILQGPVACRK